MPKVAPPPTILVDTREQLPWSFSGRLVCDLLGGPFRTLRGTLHTGDYSVAGIEWRVAIERKSLPDFIACVASGERERFWEELRRLREFEICAVIIEASLLDVEIGAYRSQARPQSVIASALAIVADFGIPIWWAGSRESAEYHAAWLLRRAWQRHLREQEEQAADAAAEKCA